MIPVNCCNVILLLLCYVLSLLHRVMATRLQLCSDRKMTTLSPVYSILALLKNKKKSPNEMLGNLAF